MAKETMEQLAKRAWDNPFYDGSGLSPDRPVINMPIPPCELRPIDGQRPADQPKSYFTFKLEFGRRDLGFGRWSREQFMRVICIDTGQEIEPWQLIPPSPQPPDRKGMR